MADRRLIDPRDDGYDESRLWGTGRVTEHLRGGRRHAPAGRAALTHTGRTREHWRDGRLHREHGPAVEREHGPCDWWVDGEYRGSTCDVGRHRHDRAPWEIQPHEA